MGIIFSHCLIKIIIKIVKPIFTKICTKIYNTRRSPTNGNRIFTLKLSKVLERLRKQECSTKILNINDSKEVNLKESPALQQAFEDAIRDTLFSDKTIISASYNGLKKLYKRKPLLDKAYGIKSIQQLPSKLKRIAEKYQIDIQAVCLLREGDIKPKADSLSHKKCLEIYDSKVQASRSSDDEANRCSSQDILPLNIDLSKQIQNFIKDTIQDSIFADKSIVSASDDGPKELYKRAQLLNDYCDVKDIKQTVGNSKHETEQRQIESRAICLPHKTDVSPLHLSKNLERFKSSDVSSLILQKCLKSYESNRSADRNSGSVNTLTATGTALFEVSSEIAGSILLPKMLYNVAENFASSKNINCQKILQSSWITDLPQIVDVMSSGNSRPKKIHNKFDMKRIKANLINL